jgi:tetratricopeptide (TPR) repeat protein
MNRKARPLTAILLALSLAAPGLLWAQAPDGLTARLNSGYDLLERGQYGQAHKIFTDVLRQDPGHPLALNNLAAIMVKQGNYNRALVCLKQALPRAKGYQVALGRVCNIDGVCAACGLGAESFGTEDLEAVVKSNILRVEMARSARPARH